MKVKAIDLKECLSWTDDFEEVYTEIVDQGRWTITKQEIYRHIPTGKCYGLYVDYGSTEQQDGAHNPWDDQTRQ